MSSITTADHYSIAKQNCRPKAAIALPLLIMLAALLGGCAPTTTTLLTQPEVVMKVAWGPFARQCTRTRTFHSVIAGRTGLKEVETNRENCIGFAAMPAANGAVEITGSTAGAAEPSVPIIYRILRGPRGVSRPAQPGDVGLLAQGSDDPESSKSFASRIGLTRQQVVEPKETLLLPILLHIPAPVEGTLHCTPDGGAVDHGRQTLVITCTLDEQAHTDSLDAKVRLAGVEEVDVQTGVRLSGSFAGSVVGYEISDNQMRGKRVDDHIWYERTMEYN